MSLWVPPSEQARAVEARQEYTAELLEQTQMLGTIREWNEKLRNIDPHLQLVKAPDNAMHPQLRPGYWHVLRLPPDGPPMIDVHEDPLTGAFREPDSGLLERLQAGDMWNDRAMKDRTERRKRIKAAIEREKEFERQERLDELQDRFKTFDRTSAVIGEKPW